MKRLSSYILLLLLASVLSSCGMEALIQAVIDQSEANGIVMSAHQLDIWVGDTLRLDCDVSYTNGHIDEEESTNILYWYTREDLVAGPDDEVDADSLPIVLRGRRITAKQLGETWVYVQCFGFGSNITEQITAESIVDSCLVRVIDWQDSLRFQQYPYDMSICAQVVLDGETMAEGVELCALVNGEVRGYGERYRSHGIDYFYLRVYGREPEGEVVTLRAYDHSTILSHDFDTRIVFDGGLHGTLSAPLRLEWNRN